MNEREQADELLKQFKSRFASVLGRKWHITVIEMMEDGRVNFVSLASRNEPVGATYTVRVWGDGDITGLGETSEMFVKSAPRSLVFDQIRGAIVEPVKLLLAHSILLKHSDAYRELIQQEDA